MGKYQVIEKLEAIEEILVDIYLNKRDLELMLNSDPEIKENVLTKYHIFSRIKFNIVRLIVINLFKVYEDKEDYSFVKIINILRQQGKSSEFRRKKDIIDKLEKDLQEIKNKEEYRTVNVLRSKFYTHLDNNRFSENTGISYNQINNLVDETRELFDRFNTLVRNTTFLFDHGGIGSIEQLLSSLNKYHKIRKETLEHHKNLREHLEIQKILEIVRQRI